MRLTIHFSPSLSVRPRRVDRSLLHMLVVVAWLDGTGDLLDVDSLMDLAVGLGDQMSSRFDECIGGATKEEIVLQYCFGFGEFLLRTFEVEVDVEGFDKFGDGILIFVGLLLDNS